MARVYINVREFKINAWRSLHIISQICVKWKNTRVQEYKSTRFTEK